MLKEKVKEFLKTKFVIFCLIYAGIFLISSYFKYLEVLLIPIMVVAFIMLDVEQGFYFFLFTQPFYVSQFLMRPAVIAEGIYVAILVVKFYIGAKSGKYPIYKTLGILIAIFTVFTSVVSLFNDVAWYSFTYVFYLPIFYVVFCTSTADEELVELAVNMVKELFDFEKVEVTVAGSVITGHCGRNTLGVLFIHD